MSETDAMRDLRANADQCQKCTQLFLTFKDKLPLSKGDAVAGISTELLGLSRILLDLRKSIDDPNNHGYYETIESDQRTLSRSIKSTLRDVQRYTAMIEELRERGKPSYERARDVYDAVWKKVSEHFADEGAGIQGCDSLTSRLKTYSKFTESLEARINGDTPPSQDVRGLRFRMNKLLTKQDRSFEDSLQFDRLNLGPSTPKFEKQKSWERKRPDPNRTDSDESYDRSHSKDRRRPGRQDRNHSRPGRGQGKKERSLDYSQTRRPDDSDGYDHIASFSDEMSSEGGARLVDWDWEPDDPPNRPIMLTPKQYEELLAGRSPLSPQRPSASSTGYFAPAAPEPPPWAYGSGVGSSSSAAATASTSGTDVNSDEPDHWLTEAFGKSRSSTLFRSKGSESGCYGDHDPEALSRLSESYERLAKLAFDDAGLCVYIYLREDDRKAKIVIRQDRGSRRQLLTVETMANLRIIRSECCLQLCQPVKQPRKNRRDEGNRNKVFLWTMLRFPTYERMVIFWCAFHALKMQDEDAQLDKLDDPSLVGEVCLFQAVIDDDGYKHALHLLRDSDSKGLRIQASALSGTMKKCPIWTAFLTNLVYAPKWAKRTEPRKVHLAELTRFIFTDEYEEQMSPRGQHEIKFLSSGDAKKFYEVLEDIADGTK